MLCYWAVTAAQLFRPSLLIFRAKLSEHASVTLDSSLGCSQSTQEISPRLQGCANRANKLLGVRDGSCHLSFAHILGGGGSVGRLVAFPPPLFFPQACERRRKDQAFIFYSSSVSPLPCRWICPKKNLREIASKVLMIVCCCCCLLFWELLFRHTHTHIPRIICLAAVF